MSLSDITKLLILLTAAVWIAWDVYVYIKDGNLPTESWTIKKWAFRIPGIAFVLGLLMGHFFFTFTEPESLTPYSAAMNEKCVSPGETRTVICSATDWVELNKVEK